MGCFFYLGQLIAEILFELISWSIKVIISGIAFILRKSVTAIYYFFSKYDKYGFDKKGIHRETGTKVDAHGFNKKGFDYEGYDRNGLNKQKKDRDGFNKKGFDKDGFNRRGFNKKGFDREGYDAAGFNKKGINKQGFLKSGYHRKTKTRYDSDGFDLSGYDKEGYDRKGYDSKGFNRDEIYIHTGTRFKEDGFDINGYDVKGFNQFGNNSEGYDRNGFNSRGIHRETKTEYNHNGFNKALNHEITGTNRDPYGFDFFGYNELGFDRDGLHKDTCEKWDLYGFDVNGINRETTGKFNKHGFTILKMNKTTGTSWNQQGFNIDGFHQITEKKFDLNGFDIDGKQVTVKVKFEIMNPQNADFSLEINQNATGLLKLSRNELMNKPVLIKESEVFRLTVFTPPENPLFLYECFIEGDKTDNKELIILNDKSIYIEIKRVQKLKGSAINDELEEVLENHEPGYFYTLLNVTSNASEKDIKTAYYKKIKENPPNQSPEIFKEIRKAYEYLSDPALRKQYDRSQKNNPMMKGIEIIVEDHMKKGQFDKALHYYETMLKEDDSNQMAMLGSFHCYLHLQRYSDMNRTMEKLIQMNPMNQQYWINYGQAALKTALHEKRAPNYYNATEKFYAARDLHAINPEPYLGIAAVHLESEEHEQALSWADKAINADGKIDFSDLKLFSFKIVVLGKWKKTANDFNEAAEILTELKLMLLKQSEMKEMLAFEILSIIPKLRKEFNFLYTVKLLEFIKELGVQIGQIDKIIEREVALSKAFKEYGKFKRDVHIKPILKELLIILLHEHLTDESEQKKNKAIFDTLILQLKGKNRVFYISLKHSISHVLNSYPGISSACGDFLNTLYMQLSGL